MGAAMRDKDKGKGADPEENEKVLFAKDQPLFQPVVRRDSKSTQSSWRTQDSARTQDTARTQETMRTHDSHQTQTSQQSKGSVHSKETYWSGASRS